MTDDRYLGCAKPVYFIGESHTLAFRDTLYQPTPSGTIYLGRVRFMQIFAQRYLIDGQIHPDIIRALQAEQLLDDNGTPPHLAQDGQALRTAEVSGIPIREPVIVMFAGDLDLFDLLRQTGKDYDFELPDDPGYGIDRTLKSIPYAAIDMRIGDIFRPFLAACQSLQDIGFRQLMVHGLPPRLRETGALDLPGSPQMRVKLTVLANRVLREACASQRVTFIDVWDELIENGYLPPDLCLNDGVHLARSAALTSWARIIDNMWPDQNF